MDFLALPHDGLRQVFFVLPEEFEEENGYRGLVAIENCYGLIRTKLFFGYDYDMALWYANRKNLFLGITPKTATRIIKNAMVPHAINSRPM